MKHLFQFIFILIIIGAVGWFYFSQVYPQTPPQTAALYFFEHLIKPQTQYKNYVIGFLPYWRLDQIENIEPNSLSELNFFSLSVDPDGHIATVANGQNDPG